LNTRPTSAIDGARSRAECLRTVAPGGFYADSLRAPSEGIAVSDAASDEALLAAYAAGDARAFADLYERHERPVYRYFLRQGATPAQADDLLQDTWLAVVRNAERFEPRAKFTTWLYTIARNKLVDHWRGRDDTLSLDDAANDPDGETPLEIDAGDQHRPDVQAMSREQARAFVDAVEQLPPAQKEAFLLQAEGGLSLEEIAAVTKAGHETVKSRLRYAMAKLRAAMEAWQ
jgi:RNA polymerase sigma-70 factor, ECF subfamily